MPQQKNVHNVVEMEQLFVYGNNIPQKRLGEILDGVVENSVNTVGFPKKHAREEPHPADYKE